MRCNGHVRLDAMLDFADRLGAADLATGHYARVTDDGLLRAAADPAKDQTYMLAALAPATLARLRFPLGELTKPRGARARAPRPACRSPPRPTRRTCASWPAPAARVPRPPRRRCASARATSSTAPGARSAATAATTTSRSASAAASASAAPEPLYVLATDARANTVTVGPRGDARDDRRSRVRASRLHRPEAEVDARAAALPLAARLPLVAARADGRAGLAEPVEGAAPGQTAVPARRRRVVGWATIA